jgi:type II secretory pathway component PulK
MKLHVSDRRFVEASSRRGLALAVALVAFVAAAAILFTVLRTMVNHERALRDEQFTVQARLLAQAGLDRGLANLRHSVAFRSETWRLEPSELNDIGPAEVQISVEPVADQTNEFQISAAADFPSGAEHRAHQTQTAIVRLPKSEKYP